MIAIEGEFDQASSEFETTDKPGAAWPQLNYFAWRFLGVLRDLAVNLEIRIHRQDAKNAKKR